MSAAAYVSDERDVPAAESGWQRMFRDLPREHGYEPLRVEGRLPDDLRGSLFRCGPAQFGIAGERYPHWFDGDGAVTAVRFGDGGASGAVRFIDTKWRRKEIAANRRIYRGYGHMGRGLRRWGLPKSPANINVMPWDGELLALWEAGYPVAVDPDTLATRGTTTLGGKLRRPLAAHPHRAGDTLFNFGVRYGPRFTLDLYAFGRDVKRFASMTLPWPTTMHDFMATPRHLVFFCSPVRVQLLPFVTAACSFSDTLAWQPELGTQVIVVPIDAPDKAIRFETDPFFQWHFINGWEEDGALVVDFLPYDDFTTNAWFGRVPYDPPTTPPASRYSRARIDLARRSMEVEVLSHASCEFPAIHPNDIGRSHEHTWLLDYHLPPKLLRFDLRTRALRFVPLGHDTFPSEPVVVPREGHPEGWVLSLVYDGASDRSYVAVIDGARPEEGAVARLWFDHAIPLSFHGVWSR